MKLPWAGAGAEQCLVIFMVVVPSIYSRSECPEDVQYSANRCFDQYNDHVQPNQNYYSGMDVEVLRAICNALTRSIRCVIELRQACPDYQHDNIMTVIAGPVINVADLCHVNNIFEKYAPDQFCYTKLKPSTSTCRASFSSETSSLEEPVGRSEPQAVTQFCRYFSSLVSCIRGHVENTCGPVAASLTEPLVRASVVSSDQCRNDLQQSTTQRTTPASVTWTSTARGGLSQNQGGAGARSEVAILLLVSLLLFNLIIHH